ncbi:Uma2 family endonuclease [Streptomyces sparsogenes]|uniref:Uma2 family endonuclease n=1 Tax=Streptomyces sparsogenes TaxID=67365 RepID=UPI0033C207B4
MTVMEIDRIRMADSNDELTLDMMFEALEEMPVPEGIKVEIVEGNIFMSPQRDTRWEIIRRVVRALEDRFGMNVKVLSDVRVDFPGYNNGLVPDVVRIAQDAQKTAGGRWRCEDAEFVAEVISKGTAANDFGPKKRAYVVAGVPVYLIVDPYNGKCHVFTEPKGEEYRVKTTIKFGLPVDLTGTAADLILTTDEFPRD